VSYPQLFGKVTRRELDDSLLFSSSDQWKRNIDVKIGNNRKIKKYSSSGSRSEKSNSLLSLPVYIYTPEVEEIFRTSQNYLLNI
jgi:hypothetical protein